MNTTLSQLLSVPASIDNYLLYRQRCGEKISFNETTQKWEPDNVPLLRLQFDSNDVLQARNPIPMVARSVREALETHLVRAGIREVEHLTAEVPNSPKRVRKPVSLSNGFRKRAISIFIEADLNYAIRERLVDHSGGLDDHYYRPLPDQVLGEYLKAEPLLTIDPAAVWPRESDAKNRKEQLGTDAPRVR